MARDTGQPTSVPHKGCNSSSCCSPAKLWRTLQTLIKNDDKKELVQFFKDDRLVHIVRVALTSRLTNDAALYPPSQQHKVVRLTSRESMLCLGKSFTDLNALQLALLVSSESMVLTLLHQLKAHATRAELKQFVNHIWGQGNSSLHLACFLKRKAVIKVLLDLGCSTDILNTKKKSASDCCLGDASVLASLEPPKQIKQIKTEPVQPKKTTEKPEEVLPAAIVVSQVPLQKGPIANPEEFLVASHCLLLFCLKHQLIISNQNTIVQPNHCISLNQLKKPPDILSC
ncbi:uncharacterized protein B0P05DRAFT_548998 [Gilbertella persicaria]|uniref:uncharacterized protein n=1 Tax=Gilbertella persicaria TaxID=101096 RepID=UPI00221FB1E9|nr:uncharacterized protein B0P05DRAFT_548998 [Gilbertella persicaria]KAI8072136.1 hypothetical protein B0P05DRAFT_548998 [Gilbertella persicaria]